MDDFSSHFIVAELPDFVASAYQLELRLRRDGRWVAADKLLRAFLAFMRDLEDLAKAVSISGTKELRASERRTRVRNLADEPSQDGEPKLADSLFVEPIPELPGSVGVNNETILDHNVEWWITNEEGSSGRVGGHIFGLFYGGHEGDMAPDDTMFREHPLFMSASARAGGGPGTIRNPIPARWFVRDAVPVIGAEWKRGFNTAYGKFDSELTAVLRTMA